MHAGDWDFLRQTAYAQRSGNLQKNAAVHDTACPRGILIFDSKGLVRFCNAALAHIVGRSERELTGRCVREFLPGLPLDPATEGYNVAFGTFHATKRSMQSWDMKTRDGRTVRVEGSLASLDTDDGYRFCLELQLRTADCETILEDMQRKEFGNETSAMYAMSGNAPEATRRIVRTSELRCNDWHRPIASSAEPVRWREWLPPSRPACQGQPPMRSPQVQLLFDRDYRISFASSTIEDLLAHDYERVTGMHVSDVLPDFPSRLGVIRSISSTTARLRSMGRFQSHARHAAGTKVPVVVALREKEHMHLISVLISATDD